jgi:hypothetical protein
MAYELQIVIDSADPHALADWWAETLGWEVEPSDEAMIKDLVAKGQAQESDTTTHNGTLVWATGAAIRSPGKPRVLFQKVPEGKTVKNRQHLDVRAGDDREAVHRNLIDRGATFLHRGNEGPFNWITMADPEGNEFCLA